MQPTLERILTNDRLIAFLRANYYNRGIVSFRSNPTVKELWVGACRRRKRHEGQLASIPKGGVGSRKQTSADPGPEASAGLRRAIGGASAPSPYLEMSLGCAARIAGGNGEAGYACSRVTEALDRPTRCVASIGLSPDPEVVWRFVP